jgi:CheY-like chemotaxis protein
MTLRVLFVDDEPNVLGALQRILRPLRHEWEMRFASGGVEALAFLAECPADVLVTDMRMPGMDGATLLHHIMVFYPDTTRILLTGDPGRDAAMNAVNKAQIFRFLAKPCPPDQLIAAVEAGVMQHRLVNAERSILKETLIGCIKALVDVLAIANPVAFGRASRVKRVCMEFAEPIQLKDFWQLEAAALLSQIGYLSLPPELVERLYYGEQLSPAEQTLAAGVPEVTMTLLENIPRLDPVIQILVALNWPDEAVMRLGDGTVGMGTRILGLVLEYDLLVTQGHAVDVAVQTLRRRSSRFGEALIEQFAHHLGAGSGKNEARTIPLRAVQPGMVIMQDVRTQLGTLLVPRGFEVTSCFWNVHGTSGPSCWRRASKWSCRRPRRWGLSRRLRRARLGSAPAEAGAVP